MEIWIQVSNPRYFTENNLDDQNIEEAIETVFPLNNENFYLVWNHIHIPLSYKYDASVMFNDIIFMVEELINKESGEFEIYWSSNTFACKWNFRYIEDELTIRAEWDAVMGKLVDVLSSCNTISISKKKFVAEWKCIILKILEALKAAKYEIVFGDEFKKIERILDSIREGGTLYEN